MDWEKLLAIARAEVDGTLHKLPRDLKERAVAVPVLFERIPNQALIADGLEPDILGLFVGPDFADEEHAVMPAQIILFLENIWDMVEGDTDEFRFEVRTTLMHELGHY